MRSFLPFLFFFLGFSTLAAQPDSSSIKKVDALVEEFYAMTYTDPDSAMRILQKAESLAKQINYPQGKTAVIRQKGMFYTERGEYVKAMALLFTALQEDEKINNGDGVGMDLLFIGLNYHYREKWREALPYMKKAEKKYSELKDEAGVILVRNNLGMVYRNMDQFDTALVYYNSARNYYTKVKKEKNLSRTENNIGNIYKDLGQYDRALEHYFVAVELKKKTNDRYSLMPTLSNIADVYVELNQFNKALEYYEESMMLAKEQKALSHQKDAHYDMSKAYERMKNFAKAFEHMNAYSILKDSTLSEKYNNDLAEMKVKYDTDKKENENILLKKDNELQEVKLSDEKKQKILFASLFGIVFIAVVLVFIQYRNKQKLNKQLAQINERMNSQNVTLRSLNKDLIESEENLTQANTTKDQLISMLSHDLYNPITSVINYTNLVVENGKEMSQQELHESFMKVNAGVVPLQDLLDNILQWAKVQKTAVVAQKEDVDLNEVLKDIIALYRPAASFKGIEIETTTEKELIIQTDRLMLFFVLRNIINNAVKFCRKNGKISVKVNVKDMTMIVVVEDEGKGFSNEVIQVLNADGEIDVISEGGSGIGLSVSRKFVRLMSAELQFKNRKNSDGAEVCLQIPISPTK